MVKQYLLNADGSWPSFVDRPGLEAQGVLFVMPVQVPDEFGRSYAEGLPELRDGVWYQTWGDVAEPVPDVAPLAQLKDECIACIDKWHEDALLTLTGKPTQAEQTTWAGKVVLAEAIMAGGTLTPSQTAFLTALGVPAAGYADYASAVLAKSALFWGIIGMADKVRSQCKDRVLGARTHAELEVATASNFAQRDAALSAVMARMQRVTS